LSWISGERKGQFYLYVEDCQIVMAIVLTVTESLNPRPDGTGLQPLASASGLREAIAARNLDYELFPGGE
jgi:hypothetical protein